MGDTSDMCGHLRPTIQVNSLISAESRRELRRFSRVSCMDSSSRERDSSARTQSRAFSSINQGSSQYNWRAGEGSRHASRRRESRSGDRSRWNVLSDVKEQSSRVDYENDDNRQAASGTVGTSTTVTQSTSKRRDFQQDEKSPRDGSPVIRESSHIRDSYGSRTDYVDSKVNTSLDGSPLETRESSNVREPSSSRRESIQSKVDAFNSSSKDFSSGRDMSSERRQSINPRANMSNTGSPHAKKSHIEGSPSSNMRESTNPQGKSSQPSNMRRDSTRTNYISNEALTVGSRKDSTASNYTHTPNVGNSSHSRNNFSSSRVDSFSGESPSDMGNSSRSRMISTNSSANAFSNSNRDKSSCSRNLATDGKVETVRGESPYTGKPSPSRIVTTDSKASTDSPPSTGEPSKPSRSRRDSIDPWASRTSNSTKVSQSEHTPVVRHQSLDRSPDSSLSSRRDSNSLPSTFKRRASSYDRYQGRKASDTGPDPVNPRDFLRLALVQELESLKEQRESSSQSSGSGHSQVESLHEVWDSEPVVKNQVTGEHRAEVSASRRDSTWRDSTGEHKAEVSASRRDSTWRDSTGEHKAEVSASRRDSTWRDSTGEHKAEVSASRRDSTWRDSTERRHSTSHQSSQQMDRLTTDSVNRRPSVSQKSYQQMDDYNFTRGSTDRKQSVSQKGSQQMDNSSFRDSTSRKQYVSRESSRSLDVSPTKNVSTPSQQLDVRPKVKNSESGAVSGLDGRNMTGDDDDHHTNRKDDTAIPSALLKELSKQIRRRSLSHGPPQRSDWMSSGQDHGTSTHVIEHDDIEVDILPDDVACRDVSTQLLDPDHTTSHHTRTSPQARRNTMISTPEHPSRVARDRTRSVQYSRRPSQAARTEVSPAHSKATESRDLQRDRQHDSSTTQRRNINNNSSTASNQWNSSYHVSYQHSNPIPNIREKSCPPAFKLNHECASYNPASKDKAITPQRDNSCPPDYTSCREHEITTSRQNSSSPGNSPDWRNCLMEHSESRSKLGSMFYSSPCFP